MDVSVRGGNLIGAKNLMVIGAPGVSAELVGGTAAVDEKAKPLFQNKCANCHEPRSPANRSLSPAQWASTVDRMINARGAEINKADRDQIVSYLQALSRAGQVTARITVAPDATPGMREVRLVTSSGASTAWSFEVGAVPEVAAAEPNSAFSETQKVTLPVVVNGLLARPAERDYFTFDAKKGQRLTFNLKGFRLNPQSQAFFSPALYLYDAKGKEVAKNLGHFGLDPLIDWTAPEDGAYTLLARDLLWHGSPASVYRLAMGPLPYDAALLPSAGRPGSTLSARMRRGALLAPGGESQSDSAAFSLRVPEGADGVTTVSTPMGDAPFLVRDLPDGGGPVGGESAPVLLPALFRGVIAGPGQTDRFKVRAVKGGATLELYARRLGSPLRAQVRILDAKGKALQTRAVEGDDDLRIANAFPSPGEYAVEIKSADDTYGPQHSYHWDAVDGLPEFSLTATPDNLNLAPGETRAILVRVTRRENMRGPIRLSVRNLPPGVTASETLIPPDDDKAVLTLTASAAIPGAAAERPAASRLVSVEGRTPLTSETMITRRARPLEIYRVNNNVRLMERASQVVTVTTEPPLFTLALGESGATLMPGREMRLTIKVLRREGFKGDVALTLPALPPGITAQNVVNVPGTQSEAIITLRANGNARFLTQARPLPNLPPMQIVVMGKTGGRNNDEGGACTLPIPIHGKTGAETAK